MVARCVEARVKKLPKPPTSFRVVPGKFHGAVCGMGVLRRLHEAVDMEICDHIVSLSRYAVQCSARACAEPILPSDPDGIRRKYVRAILVFRRTPLFLHPWQIRCFRTPRMPVFCGMQKNLPPRWGKFCTVRVCISLTICNVTNVSSTSSAKVAPQV